MYTAAVVTVSDRSARGERPDTAGPLAVSMLEAAGFQVLETLVVPDERADIRNALTDLADAVHREKKKSVVAQLKNQPTQERKKAAPKKSAEKER